jgi:hypothetical protein
VEKLSETTLHDWEERGLEDMFVECQITWIFKRKRKSIDDSNGELEVTITRSVLPKQTCVWWQRLTIEEKNACVRNLKYDRTWSKVLSITIFCSNNSQLYSYKLKHLDDEGNETVDDAPTWATWSEYRVNSMRPMFEESLSLMHSAQCTAHTDVIQYDI